MRAMYWRNEVSGGAELRNQIELRRLRPRRWKFVRE